MNLLILVCLVGSTVLHFADLVRRRRIEARITEIERCLWPSRFKDGAPPAG
jgi:hypothetical protein